MKRTVTVSMASLLFLLLASAVAYFTRSVFTSVWIALGVGLGILALSGAIAFFVKERVELNLLCFFISAVAMGVLIRSWYIFREIDNSPKTMILVSLCAALYLFLFFALSRLPFVHNSKGAYVALCVLYAILSVAAYIFVVAKTETTYVSTFGYYMSIELAFIFAMSLEVENRSELIRNLTLSTYSIFLVAIIAAVIALFIAGGDGDCDCDCGPDGCCDCLECCDGCAPSRGGKKGKKQ